MSNSLISRALGLYWPLSALRGKSALCAVFAATLLIGCSSPRVAYEDFCAAQGRQIPRSERIIYVLEEIAKRPDEFSDLHYMTWQRSYRATRPNLSGRQVAETYVERFPLCCEVVPPAYLSDKLINDNEWDDRVEEALRRYPGFWVVDVRILRDAAPSGNSRDIDYTRIGVSACNDKVSRAGIWL